MLYERNVAKSKGGSSLDDMEVDIDRSKCLVGGNSDLVSLEVSFGDLDLGSRDAGAAVSVKNKSGKVLQREMTKDRPAKSRWGSERERERDDKVAELHLRDRASLKHGSCEAVSSRVAVFSSTLETSFYRKLERQRCKS